MGVGWWGRGWVGDVGGGRWEGQWALGARRGKGGREVGGWGWGGVGRGWGWGWHVRGLARACGCGSLGGLW